MQENLTKGWQFVLIVENGEQPVISIGLAYRNPDISAINVAAFYIKSADCWLNHVH
jgi:hypothetical protein|tara:strand:- start:5636 stop:5803 length:168 start_codon:yes stop_codon:yes gene_type:complete